MRGPLGLGLGILVVTIGAAAAGEATITVADLNRMRDTLERCWPSAGHTQTSGEVVVQLWLAADGRVERTEIVHQGPPADPWLQEMEARARRAILRCQPYPLPAGQPGHLLVTAKLPLPQR
jgi:hypothetical protein